MNPNLNPMPGNHPWPNHPWNVCKEMYDITVHFEIKEKYAKKLEQDVELDRQKRKRNKSFK